MIRPELTRAERDELRRQIDAARRARMRRDAALEREFERHISGRPDGRRRAAA